MSTSSAPSAPSAFTQSTLPGTWFNPQAQHPKTIKPITAIGSGGYAAATNPAQSTGVSAMPQVQASFSSPQVSAGNPNPLDATYFTDIGKLDTYFQTQTADINAAIASTNAQADASNRNLDMALATLNHNQPLDIQRQQFASNKSGLLNSGFEQTQEGNINYQYDQNRTQIGNSRADLTRRVAETLAGFQRQLGDLNANYGPNGYQRQSALQAAVARAMAADQAAAANMSFPQAGPAISGTPVAGYQSIPYTSPSGARGVLHIYPDGRKVFVKGGPNGIINRI